MSKVSKQCILYERLKRQRLLEPIASGEDEEEYIELFKLLQPVAPVHFTFPGSPPKLVHRTAFNDNALSFQLRKKHRLIKGRFAGGRVGYVLQEDLERYATAFRKSLTKIKPIHEDILSIIQTSGGISKDQLKEELDYPNKEISKALVSMQEAFIVYEDQIETDWDTGWFDFKTEWLALPASTEQHISHVSQVLKNYLRAMVFATFSQIKDWSQINSKILKQALEQLETADLIELTEVEQLGEGYMLKDDAESLDLPSRLEQRGELYSIFMLDQSDIMVRSHLSELKSRYKGQEVLQYLLIDGEFKGVVVGHWRIGPYDIDDVQVDLSTDEAEERKAEVIKAIRKSYSSEKTAILKYNGEAVE